MAPQRDSQKDENEIIELASLSPTTTRRSGCLRLQVERDNKQCRRVTFAHGTKEMSIDMSAISTPTSKRSGNTWNPANGWKIDPSVKLSFDVVDLYRGPRLGELASYASSLPTKRRTSANSSSSRFQTDADVSTDAMDCSCPLKRTPGTSRIQSEKLSDAPSTDDIDSAPLKRTPGCSRIQSEKLSDVSSSSSSPMKHRRTCRSELPATDEIVFLNQTTIMDTENQTPNYLNNSSMLQSTNASLFTSPNERRSQDNRNCFDQTIHPELTIPSSKEFASQAVSPATGTKSFVNPNQLISAINEPNVNILPSPKLILCPSTTFGTSSTVDIADDQTYSLVNPSLSLSFPGRSNNNTTPRRQRETVLAFHCFLCFFCAFLFALCFQF